MKYIITYENALKMCEKYNNFNFSEHLYMIDGFKISVFDYFICEFNDFNNPLGDENINAFDMRGVTFVFNKDGSLYKRYLMLPKFFNLNQVEQTQYINVINKKIKNISIKEDGSLISFMMLPNGNIFCKTIKGFTNEQTQNSIKILNDNNELKNWIENIIKEGFTPLFEYVSFDNRIVLKYSKPELRFIGLRNNNDGDFVPAIDVNTIIPKNICCVESVNFNLDELISKSKYEENKEGWVVLFEDKMLMKVKTNYYFNMHNLRTNNIFREDYIIKNYYDQKLDDIMCQLNKEEDKDAFLFVDNVLKSINNYSNYIDKHVNNLYVISKNYENYNEFAKQYHKEHYFDFVKYFENKEQYVKRKINFVLKNTNKLNKAKEIIKKYERES